MSYCRGWIYIIRTGDELVCMSQLHLRADVFATKDRREMRRHVLEHQEDADEINDAVAKVTKRLDEEIEMQGYSLEPLSGER